MHHDNRFAALDGMRGLAAIFVLLFHLGQWQYRPTLAANAGLAVDFFFTLSGYVLALAYAGRLDAGMSPWRFFVLRLIRLMPLIIVATLISAGYLVAKIYWLDDVQVKPGELLVATGVAEGSCDDNKDGGFPTKDTGLAAIILSMAAESSSRFIKMTPQGIVREDNTLGSFSCFQSTATVQLMRRVGQSGTLRSINRLWRITTSNGKSHEYENIRRGSSSRYRLSGSSWLR